MVESIHKSIRIEQRQQGSYFYIPFEVSTGIKRLEISYEYNSRSGEQQDIQNGIFIARPEINIIDIGLIAPNGEQIGASGSDKTHFFVSEHESTPGYQAVPIIPGIWQILVGAYKIHPDGVKVTYQIMLEHKEGLSLYKGDLHTHTLASDGVHTLEELAWKAKRNGLDFVAITDHNQFVSEAALAGLAGVTMIPGVEWTHYQGHANFIGSSRPYDGIFAANSLTEVQAKFESARQGGALISINHPFDETCGFQFNLSQLPFDCLEVWNGPMRESNLKAVGYWHQLLCAGQKIPICGGSDYHRDTPFIFLGGPTMGVYAQSLGMSDLLDAIRSGHSFITFSPSGPVLELHCGEAILGDGVFWSQNKPMNIIADGLLAGDVVRVITANSSEVLFKAPADGRLEIEYGMQSPGFARVEILRAFLPGLPMLPALLSNPIYFDTA